MLAQIQRALRRRRYEAAPTEETEPKSPTSPTANDKKVEGFHFYSTRKRENGTSKRSEDSEHCTDTTAISAQSDSVSFKN